MGRARAATGQGCDAILNLDVVLDRAAIIATTKPGSATLVIPEDAQVANSGKAQAIAVFRGHWVGITYVVGEALEAGNDVEFDRFIRLFGPQPIHDRRIGRFDDAGPLRHYANTDSESRGQVLAASRHGFLDVAHTLKLIGENEIVRCLSLGEVTGFDSGGGLRAGGHAQRSQQHGAGRNSNQNPAPANGLMSRSPPNGATHDESAVPNSPLQGDLTRERAFRFDGPPRTAT